MVYLGPVEMIAAKGPKTYEYYFASWKDGFRSSKHAYPRDDLVKAELVWGNSPPAPEWLRPTHMCSDFCIKRNFRPGGHITGQTATPS